MSVRITAIGANINRPPLVSAVLTAAFQVGCRAGNEVKLPKPGVIERRESVLIESEPTL